MTREQLTSCDKEKFSGFYFSFVIVALLLTSLIFSTIALSFGENVKNQPLYIFLSYSLSGITIILVTFVYITFKKDKFIESVGLKRCKPIYFLYAILLFVAVFFGLGGVNLWFSNFLTDIFGYTPSIIELPNYSIGNYILVIITLCVLPAVTEEIAFRGIIQSGILTGNTILNCVISGALFSFFHMNPAQTPYQFAMGFVLALITAKSRSILPAITAHFINNLTVVTSEYFFPNFLSNGVVFLVATIVGIVCFALIIYTLLKKEKIKEEKGEMKNFFLYSSFGLLVCFLIWVSNLFVI